MGRAIVAPQRASIAQEGASRSVPDGDAAEPESGDRYGDRLLKLIPGEVVSLYLSMVTIVNNSADAGDDPWAPWIILCVGAAATWIYLRYTLKVTNSVQLAVSVVAFLVWAFTIGGPFEQFSWYSGTYAGIALATFTFLAPIIPINNKGKSN